MATTWRSKLNTKYEKLDIDNWDVKLKAEMKVLKQKVDNKGCFDCGVEDVTWASPKLGIFMCVACSDVHRATGAHITCVKNFSTYLWGPDEVALMKAVGNKRGRELYGRETVSPGADKNAKVEYCTRKYGSPEVQQLVEKEVVDAKAVAEKNLTGTAHCFKMNSLTQSQQATTKERAAQTFSDDFFSEPCAAAAQPKAECTKPPEGLLIDNFRSHNFAPKTSAQQEIGFGRRVEAKPVITMTLPDSNHVDLEDFLTMCNPAVQKQVVNVAADDEDLFAGWESWN